jgi:hypothetical protein
MALEIRNLGLKEGRIVLKDDGTFLVCEVLQQIGVWDTVANNWALHRYSVTAGLVHSRS